MRGLRAWTAVLLAAAWAGRIQADDVEYSGNGVWDERENSVASTPFSLAKTFWLRTKASLAIELDLRPWMNDPKALREVLVRNREFCEANLAPAPPRKPRRARQPVTPA